MTEEKKITGILSKKKKYPPIEHMPANPALGQMKKDDAIAWKKKYREARAAGKEAMAKAMLPVGDEPTKENLKKVEEKDVEDKNSAKVDELRAKLAEAQENYDKKPSGGGKAKINRLNKALDEAEDKLS